MSSTTPRPGKIAGTATKVITVNDLPRGIRGIGPTPRPDGETRPDTGNRKLTKLEVAAVLAKTNRAGDWADDRAVRDAALAEVDELRIRVASLTEDLATARRDLERAQLSAKAWEEDARQHAINTAEWQRRTWAALNQRDVGHEMELAVLRADLSASRRVVEAARAIVLEAIRWYGEADRYEHLDLRLAAAVVEFLKNPDNLAAVESLPAQHSEETG